MQKVTVIVKRKCMVQVGTFVIGWWKLVTTIVKMITQIIEGQKINSNAEEGKLPNIFIHYNVNIYIYI